MKQHHTLLRFIAAVLFVFPVMLSASTPKLWVSKSIAPDTIYYEGAPDSSRATVTLRAWASSDSITTGQPIDVLFACDLSGSMNATSGSPSRWRITWSQISALRFIDSLNSGYDRVGVLGWTASMDNTVMADTSNATRFHQRWFPLSSDLDAAKRFVRRDLHMDGNFDRDLWNGDTLVRQDTIPGGDFNDTPLRLATVVGLRYLKTNAVNPATMILLTDGEHDDNVDSTFLYRYVDSMYKHFSIRTYAIGFQGGNMTFLRRLAGAGGGSAYEANTPSQLDSIFRIISLQLTDVVATSVSSATPLMIDVLGPGIHYVPGSYVATSGPGFVVPKLFKVDTVNSQTRLTFIVDTVRTGKVIEVNYQLTAALRSPNPLSPTLMRANNNFADDTSNYSRVLYRNVEDTIDRKAIPRKYVWVKCGISGLRLSLDSTRIMPPSPTKVISLPYTPAAPARYRDTLMYSLLRVLGTGTAVDTPVQATWNFTPNPNWIPSTNLNNVTGSRRTIGVTAPYNYADSRTLGISFALNGRTYLDSLVFMAFDSAHPPVNADTTDRLVLYDQPYSFETARIESAYTAQGARNAITLDLGDTVTFWPFMFDLKPGGPKYLGTRDIEWTLNGGTPITAATFGLLGTKAQSTDRLVASWRNELGQILRDTVTINWGFGLLRFLSLESRPGRVGDTVSSPLSGPILIPPNADTVRGLYAVVRDEFGNCVYDGQGTQYGLWSVSGGSAYVSIPAATQSAGWIYRKGNPASETVFYLRVAGSAFAGLQNRKDSVEIRLIMSAFTGLAISAGGGSRTPIKDISGHVYAPGEDIPKTALLVLNALADTVVLQAQARSGSVWSAQSVEWRLTNPAVISGASLPEGASVELIPENSVPRDTLIATYRYMSGPALRDTVIFTVGLSWIDTLIIVYGDTNVSAGDSFRFTILAIDRNGDTVRISDRLPSGFTLTSDGTLLFVGSEGSRLLQDTSLVLTDPFLNGLSQNTLVPWSAGTQRIIIAIPYPTPDGTAWFRDTILLSVSAGDPDSLVVVRDRDGRPAIADTLCTITGVSGDTAAGYRVLLYDAYGNLIPFTDGAYPLVRLSLSGSGLDSSRITRTGDRFGYHAAGSTRGGSGTVTALLVSGGDTLFYRFSLTVIPVVRVLSAVTREWVPDTLSGITEIETVLKSALGLDPDSLYLAKRDSGSRMGVFQNALAQAGYPSGRDGYLDRIDLTFSEPFYLSEPVIIGIRFAWDRPSDTVSWMRSLGGRRIAILPADALTGPKHRQYHVWLISNALRASRSTPLETGFLPAITFSNDLIRQRDSGTGIPLLLGGLVPEYTTDSSLTRDSTPPIVADFLFQNNACQSEESRSRIFIGFSEPVQTPALGSLSSLTGLTLLSRSGADSLFLLNAVRDAKPSDRILRAPEAWNLDNDPAKVMTLVADIRPESLQLFLPEVSRLRLSLEPGNTRIVDLSGNRACISPSPSVRLENDPGTSPTICSITGTTVTDRNRAMNLSWSMVGGEQVPDFPFFGFSANLQNLLVLFPRDQVQFPAVAIGGKSVVICDFDSDFVMIESQAQVFDLMGNLTASPTSHPMLSSRHTISEIRRYLGMEPLETFLRSLRPEEVERYFSVSPASSAGAPDTLRPIYPPMLTLGYDFMRKNCGPEKEGAPCVPAWNCLNAKGRLVAPGGYIVTQRMRVGTARAEVSRKVLVKSGEVRF